MKFLRQQVNYKKRIPKNWRKPKGRHSKLREKRHGIHAMPDIGYRSPKVQRNKQEAIVLIKNINDIKPLNEGVIVRLSSRIGNKKKIMLLEACIKKKLVILNYKKSNEVINKIKDLFTKRKESKAKKLKIKTEKKEAIKKAEAEKKPSEEVKKKVVVKKSEEKKEVENK